MTEELNLNNYLYHITNFNALEGILTQDTLKAGKTHHWKDLQSTGQFRNAVSLTRDLTFSSRYMPSSASVILVLDKDKLISKYKITPVADTANELNPQTGRRAGQSKAEECIYSDITNLHNYLVKILIKNSAQMPESTSDILKEYNSKYNIPFTLTECLTEADHTQKAIDTFGTTYYKTRAGFMLKDGRLLDLTYGGGPREDHRNIQDAFDDMDLDSESDYLIEFMNEGNIRLIPEMPGIDIVVEPTDKQYAALKGYIDFFIGRNKYFGIQFSNKNGDQVDWKEYNGFVSPAEIILDIKEYFDGTSLNESYDYTVSDIIGTDTLYHATYKPYWEEIKKSGVLRPKAHSNWDISGDFIYLSRDPDNAFSYAETSELVPEEYLDQIVVLEIDANKLNLDLLDCDHNQAYGAEGYDVDYEDPQTWEEMQYAGSIPLRAIKKVHGESELEEGMEKSKHHQMTYYNAKAALQNYILRYGRIDGPFELYYNFRLTPSEIKDILSYALNNKMIDEYQKDQILNNLGIKEDQIDESISVPGIPDKPTAQDKFRYYWELESKAIKQPQDLLRKFKNKFPNQYDIWGETFEWMLEHNQESFVEPQNYALYLEWDLDFNWGYIAVVEFKTRYQESLNEVYPQKNETKSDFINRFMRVTAKEYPNVKQRYAVAYSYWNNRDKRKLNESTGSSEIIDAVKNRFVIDDYPASGSSPLLPEQITKNIKRAYSSGVLYEAVEFNSIFNLKKIGMRHYDEWLNSQSIRDRDNVKIEIKELSPKEYLDACAEIFGNNFESQKRQIQYDKEIIQELQDLIEKGVSLNATFLDYVSNPPTQEGRHRMYALAELYGWDKRYPVIIFTPADPERAKRDQLEKQQEKLYKYIDKAVTNALDYTYRNYDELKDQISYYLENYIDDPEVKISERGHWLAIIVNGLEYEISQDEFDWDEDKSDPDDDFDIEDLS